MKYGVVTATITASSRVEEKEPPRLTAAIVEFEPAIVGCCCLCNRRRVLSFCLEYFDNGRLFLWGEICENCAGKLTETVRPVDGHVC